MASKVRGGRGIRGNRGIRGSISSSIRLVWAVVVSGYTINGELLEEEQRGHGRCS